MQRLRFRESGSVTNELPGASLLGRLHGGEVKRDALLFTALMQLLLYKANSTSLKSGSASSDRRPERSHLAASEPAGGGEVEGLTLARNLLKLHLIAEMLRGRGLSVLEACGISGG